MTCQITDIFAVTTAFLAVLLVFLSGLVIRQRHRCKQPNGLLEDNPAFMMAHRAQQNFVEYVPLALLLIWLNIDHQAAYLWTVALCAILVLGRLLHALGLLVCERRDVPNMKARMVGTFLTFVTLIGAALSLLWQVLSGATLYKFT